MLIRGTVFDVSSLPAPFAAAALVDEVEEPGVGTTAAELLLEVRLVGILCVIEAETGGLR